LDVLFDQAHRAFKAGFDGVTVPEHHNGFSMYLPTPLQVVGWLLQEFSEGWAAAYPALIPSRPTELWIEELAWLTARFPQRVGLGTAPGYVKDDFRATGSEYAGRFDRYWATMEVLVNTLNGRPPESLARDPAVMEMAQAILPIVAAAAGSKSIAHAARLGLGIAPPGEDDECIRIVNEYRAAGGNGPRVLNRWPFVMTPELRSHLDGADDQAGVWESEESSRARFADRSWMKNDPKQVQDGTTPQHLAAQLNQSIVQCSSTCLSIRLHKHEGAGSPEAVGAMIDGFAEVIPLLKFPTELAASPKPS